MLNLRAGNRTEGSNPSLSAILINSCDAHRPSGSRHRWQYEFLSGEMAEWLKARAWKVREPERVPWVRIPLSPPGFL